MPACAKAWMKRCCSPCSLIGISGLCNLVASIKTARYYDMDGRDVIFMPLTDSMDLYASRMEEMQETHGPLHDAPWPTSTTRATCRESQPITFAS